MKTLQEIYNSIRDIFYNKTSIDVQKGSVIDSIILSTSSMIEEAYNEIENNKTPHIYTNLKGSNLDDLAILVGLTRRPDESDKNFLYRIMKWNISNKASNLDAIETALMDMEYCSHVTYVPKAYGCGTAAAYIIPKNMEEQYNNLAIEETKNRLQKITSPSSYINYIIPEILDVKINILYKTSYNDISATKKQINDNIINYINGIAPGSYLEVGQINKFGMINQDIDYFNVSNIFINNLEIGEVSVLQKIETKLLIGGYEDINWVEVE